MSDDVATALGASPEVDVGRTAAYPFCKSTFHGVKRWCVVVSPVYIDSRHGRRLYSTTTTVANSHYDHLQMNVSRSSLLFRVPHLFTKHSPITANGQLKVDVSRQQDSSQPFDAALSECDARSYHEYQEVGRRFNERRQSQEAVECGQPVSLDVPLAD